MGRLMASLDYPPKIICALRVLDCKQHLDQCEWYLMCDSAYNMAMYNAMPKHPCPAPPANYTPPPPIGECQLNLTKGVCKFEKSEGREIRFVI